MVEQSRSLDSIFASLSDPTRRDILRRVARKELTVSQVAKPYRVTFAAISKHLMVLERANLITKRRQGKQQYVRASPTALKNAAHYLERYRSLWEERFDLLEDYLRKEAAGHKTGRERRPG